MSIKELLKRQNFINKLDDEKVKLRLYDALNTSTFWRLAKSIV